MVQTTSFLFPVPSECTLLPSYRLIPKCFSVCCPCGNNTAINSKNLTLMYHLHLILRGSRSASSTVFTYYISLVSFRLKQFLHLWLSWPFEDYRLVILHNVFEFGLAFMIRSGWCIIEGNIKVSKLCFSNHIVSNGSQFSICPLTEDFLLLIKVCLPGSLK